MSNKEGRSENGSARKEIGRRDGATTKPKGSKMVRRKNKSGEDTRTAEPKRCVNRKNGIAKRSEQKRGSGGKESGSRQTIERVNGISQRARQDRARSTEPTACE
jgi:hypothetical protein